MRKSFKRRGVFAFHHAEEACGSTELGLKKGRERIAGKLQYSMELKSFLSSFSIIVIPLLVILVLMSHLLISNYKTREMESFCTVMEGSLERMDFFVQRLNSATLQMAGNTFLRANSLRANPTAFSYIRDSLVYINNANRLQDVAFYSPGTPELFHTTMGTYNRAYYKRYALDDGREVSALEAFATVDTMRFFPYTEQVAQRVAFEPALDIVFAVPRQRQSWMIYSVTQEQLVQELAIDYIDAGDILLLDPDGRALLSVTRTQPFSQAAYQKLLSAEDGRMMETMPGGVYLISVKSKTSGFQLGVLVSSNKMYGAVNRISMLLYGFTLLVALLSAGLLTLLSYWTARPVRELLALAENLSCVSEGDSSVPVIIRLRELLLDLGQQDAGRYASAAKQDKDACEPPEAGAAGKNVDPPEMQADQCGLTIHPEQTNELISRVLAFLSETENVGQLNAGMVAQHFDVEISNLSHQFKDATSYTLSDYLNARKLLIACKSLAESDEPITAIAERLGYLHTSSFARMFKKVYGVSPTEYRMQARERQEKN